MRAALCVVLAAAALAGGRADAHAFLQSAVPAVGSTVPAPPASVLLVFTEGVEPSFSTVAVLDSQGADVTGGRAARDGGPQRLAAPLKRLAPGVYTVVWHVVSVDTHKTEGRFTFTVQPSSGS